MNDINNGKTIKYKELISKTFTFNIITTNKNNTAIAPTYMITNSIPRKSILNNSKIADETQKDSIKNKTE